MMLATIRECDMWLASVRRVNGLTATKAGLPAKGEAVSMMIGIS
jgi:hypothetical protein